MHTMPGPQQRCARSDRLRGSVNAQVMASPPASSAVVAIVTLVINQSVGASTADGGAAGTWPREVLQFLDEHDVAESWRRRVDEFDVTRVGLTRFTHRGDARWCTAAYCRATSSPHVS